MKRLITTILIATAVNAGAQALREINYNYLYDPGQSFSLSLKPVRLNESWVIAYHLRSRDTTFHVDQLVIEWQGREDLSEKDHQALAITSETQKSQTQYEIAAAISLQASDAPKVVTAKVIDPAQKRAWYFFTSLEENYPVNNYLLAGNRPLLKPYVSPGDGYELADSAKTWVVSYYDDNFPAAAPAFSEGQAKVSKTMRHDSLYRIRPGEKFSLLRKGLYLFQTDTLTATGFAVRVETDYPKFTKFQNLPGPLIYICTKQEYDRLELSADKKSFDRTVLSITADTERAKKLIRSYFRRVEFANEYFTSYKEGWKTDRGMIYIIFGLPDEVYRFKDREVWHYQEGKLEQTFDFVKSPTLFDPDNYVLVRNSRFREQWYEIIDLWRNARF